MKRQEKTNLLQAEIDKVREEIHTDGYSMSIGEWMSIYEDGDLDMHPEFQRFYRWSREQKSSLIESILLGIPIPPIFVSQRGDGKWDVIDGLQRLSTIFQFAGILRDENDKLVEPLVLEKTAYLPSLENRVWDEEIAQKIQERGVQLSFFFEEFPPEMTALTEAQQRFIKREKIAVSIILKESDKKAKYELFQRLNTGGSLLSYQEVRNAILVMTNAEMFRWMKALSENESFTTCTTSTLTDKNIEEQYDLELVLRFLVLHKLQKDQLERLGSDVNRFLTNEMIQLATQDNLDYQAYENAFNTTFRLLSGTTGEDSFRRYDSIRERFLGGFRIPAYEVIIMGIGSNLEMLSANPSRIQASIKGLWNDKDFIKYSGGGMGASYRIPKFVSIAEKHFK